VLRKSPHSFVLTFSNCRLAMALTKTALVCLALIGSLPVADASDDHTSLVQKRAVAMSSEDVPDETSDVPIEMLAPDATSTVEQKWQQVTCPVIGALFKAGDLKPDENGIINKIQTRDAMLRAGISQAKTTDTTNGNFDHLPEPKEINLFNMDLQMASKNPKELRNKEHDFSTGVRDGHRPNATAYEVFEQFIGTDGDSQTWSQIDVAEAIKYYKEHTNDQGVGIGGITSLSVMLAEFANSDGKLSKDEMKNLFLRSGYPAEFAERRAAAVKAWYAAQVR